MQDDNAFFRWLGYVPKLEAIDDLELLTLKIHVVVEDALQHLLAHRLDIDEKQMKKIRLRFQFLVTLALGGLDAPEQLRPALLALDDARNFAAHRIGSVDFTNSLQAFIKHAAGFDPLSRPAHEVTVASVRVAGQESIEAVFGLATRFWRRF